MESEGIPTQYFIRMALLKMAQVDRFTQKLEPIGESESLHCPSLSKRADSNQVSWCVSEGISCQGIRKMPEVCVFFVYNNKSGTNWVQNAKKEKPRFS